MLMEPEEARDPLESRPSPSTPHAASDVRVVLVVQCGYFGGCSRPDRFSFVTCNVQSFAVWVVCLAFRRLTGKRCQDWSVLFYGLLCNFHFSYIISGAGRVLFVLAVLKMKWRTPLQSEVNMTFSKMLFLILHSCHNVIEGEIHGSRLLSRLWTYEG